MLQELIDQHLPLLTTLRHELHAHPELGFEETETAQRILRHLSTIDGLTIRRNVAKTGIVATLRADAPGPCIALRADMDCLPIQEEGTKPYASAVPGKMHACGHDGHTTCLVGAALVLGKMADRLQGPVRFLFQPAEEGGGGGRVMCEEGALDDPKVSAVFGLHGWPSLDVGQVATRSGPITASSDSFEITIRGKGAHAAFPHLSIDPIVVASHIVTALQSIASRNVDPLDSVVVTIGKIAAGTTYNIIPEKATLWGTVRALRPETRAAAHERIRAIAENLAGAFEAKSEVTIFDGYPPTVNHPRAVAFFEQAAGAADVVTFPEQALEPVMGAEDFSFYAQRVPSAFWLLGVRPQGAECFPSLHQADYDFNDDAIRLGVRIHCELALRFAPAWCGC